MIKWMKHYKESEKKHQTCLIGFLWTSEQHYPWLLKAAGNPGSLGPEARQAAASTLISQASQHTNLQLFLCFTLKHHCLKDARPMCGCGALPMSSCTFSTPNAACSSSPASLCKAHTQPTYPTALNFSQGKGWKFTAAKTAPFLDLLSDEDKKSTEEGPLQGRRLYVFPPRGFTYFQK